MKNLRTKPLPLLIALFTALVLGASFLLADYSKVNAQKVYANSVETTDNSIENCDIWQGNQLLGEDHAGVYIYYYYDETGICGANILGTDYYYRKNMLGDVIEIYDSTGFKHAAYSYDAWGRSTTTYIASWVADWNPIRYRSYYMDMETGLYYLQSRYYDPEIGRFINADDPINLFYMADITFGTNLYAYCLNNPLSYIDETGELLQRNDGGGREYRNESTSSGQGNYILQQSLKLTEDWTLTDYVFTALCFIPGLGWGANVARAGSIYTARIAAYTVRAAKAGSAAYLITAKEIAKAARAWGRTSTRTARQNMMFHFDKHVIGDGGKMLLARNPVTFTRHATNLWKSSKNVGRLMPSGAIKIKLASGVGGFYSKYGKILSFFYT